ncbi:mechanosensitive ion channel family protein [Halobacteriaceae archaeon GCM10025711]
MSLPWEAALGQFSTPSQRAGVAAAILFGFILLSVVVWRLAGVARERYNRHLVDVLQAAIVLGAATLVGASLVVLFEAQLLVDQVATALNSPFIAASRTVLSLALLGAVYVATGTLHRFVNQVVARRDQFTDHQAEVSYRVLQVVAYGFAGVVILSLWDVEIGGLLIGAGFMGIVVGMAARQTLGAMLAGFVLMFSRPFEIGDWVEIDDVEGIVTDITIVNTRVQTFDGEYVMLPNDNVSGSNIVNRSRKGRLRLNVEVGVDYDADLDESVELAKDAMRDVDAILTVPQPQVVFKRFGDSAVVLGLRFWIDKPSARRKWRAQTAVIGAVKDAFDDGGVKIPFPQRELTGREETDGFRVDGAPSGMALSPEGAGDGDD